MAALDEKKQRALLFGLIGLVFLVIYFQVLLKPRLESLVKVSSEVARKYNEVKQAKDDIANIPIAKKQIEELRKKISFYEEKMPTQKEIPALLGDLSRFAQETDIKIIGILPIEKIEGEIIINLKTGLGEPGVSKKQEPYFEIPIKVEAKAKYHNLGFFINKLETAGRFMKVSDIQIRANPNTPRWHDVRLFVTTYVLSEEEKVKK